MQIQQHIGAVEKAAYDGIEMIFVVLFLFLRVEIAVQVALDETRFLRVGARIGNRYQLQGAALQDNGAAVEIGQQPGDRGGAAHFIAVDGAHHGECLAGCEGMVEDGFYSHGVTEAENKEIEVSHAGRQTATRNGRSPYVTCGKKATWLHAAFLEFPQTSVRLARSHKGMS